MKQGKKKILVVSNMFPSDKHPAYGTFVKRFCEQLVGLDYECVKSVMCASDGKIHKASNYAVFYVRTFMKCLFGKYSLVYVHYASHSSPAVLLANKIRELNVVVNLHGSDAIPNNASQERMQKYTIEILKIAKYAVVPSEYFKKYVSEKYSYPKERIFIYPSGGIDETVFHPVDSKTAMDTIVSKFKLADVSLRVGFVGRLVKSKGWETYLKAIKILIGKICYTDQIEFVMVGNGEDSDELESFISENKLSGIVNRFPLLSQVDLADMYRCISLLIFPSESESESLGLVAIEAMASGAIVIASDCAAPKYYIRDGINGLKFPPKDSDALSDKIVEFLAMPEEQKARIRKNGLETAREFNLSNTQEKLKEIMGKIIDKC